jgi:hypothetical protein
MTVLSATGRAPALASRPGRAVVHGIITLVQEGRFQLEDFEGMRRLSCLLTTPRRIRPTCRRC